MFSTAKRLTSLECHTDYLHRLYEDNVLHLFDSQRSEIDDLHEEIDLLVEVLEKVKSTLDRQNASLILQNVVLNALADEVFPETEDAND